MPKNPSQVPENFPASLGRQILKSDVQRQVAMVRQEVLTDLAGLLELTHEPVPRKKLLGLIERHCTAGTRALEKSADLWPDPVVARETIQAQETKASVQARNLKLYQQFEAVQTNSVSLLEKSFDHIRVIVEQSRAMSAPPPASGKTKETPAA